MRNTSPGRIRGEGARTGVTSLRGLALQGPVREALHLDRYVGIYDSIWGQWAVLRWKEGLAALWLHSRDPGETLFELKPDGEHVFRRVREDDEDQPGERIVFEVDDTGAVTGFRRHSNVHVKVR